MRGVVALLVAVLLAVPAQAASTQDRVDAHAQAWAEHLAASGQFYHSNLNPLSVNTGGPCEWVGENLYRGHSGPEKRWELYAESPGHNRMMNHSRTHHGVGVAQTPEGAWYVADVFCVEASAPTTTTTTTTTTATAPAVDVPVKVIEVCEDGRDWICVS